jgi:putative ABC transport system permease protein
VLLSFGVAVSIGWSLLHKWREDYAYKTKLSAEVSALMGLAAVAIAILTISYQSIKAARINPVPRFKSE